MRLPTKLSEAQICVRLQSSSEVNREESASLSSLSMQGPHEGFKPLNAARSWKDSRGDGLREKMVLSLLFLFPVTSALAAGMTMSQSCLSVIKKCAILEF